MIPLEITALLDNSKGIERKVQERCGSKYHENYIIPRHVIDLLNAFASREDYVAEHYDESNESGKAKLFEPGGEESYINTEKRENGQNASNDKFGSAFPNTNI